MQSSVQVQGQRPPALQPVDSELDLGALGAAIWARKGTIILLTLAATIIAFIAVNLITPIYKSESRILIEGRENIFLRPEAERTPIPRGEVDQEAIASQVQLLMSRDLALEVIKKLKLGELPEFDPVLGRISPVKRVLVYLGLRKDPLQMTKEERVLQSFSERLSVYAVDRSRVIVIGFESENPELAARVANTIAEVYLTMQKDAKREQTRAAGQWLAGEIEKLRKRVAEAESRAEAYRSKANLLVGTNNTTLSNQQLGEFNSQVGAARAQKADAESRAKLIRSMLKSGKPLDLTDIVNSELMRRLSEQQVTLRAQLAEQSATLLPGHPRIKELRAQIANLDRQILSEADRIARSLENEAVVADARVKALSANLDQLKRQATTVNEQDVQLRALEREAKAQRDLLSSYLAKYREAVARDSVEATSADARIISRATVSNTPAFPKKLPTVIVAALAMFVLSTGLVATSALLRGAVFVPVGGAVVGTFAPASEEPAQVPAAAAETAVRVAPTVRPLNVPRPSPGITAEAIDAAVGDVRSAGEAARRITVVGAARMAGTTVAATSLARALATENPVVLVDLALAAPNLSVISSEPQAPGLAELVRGEATFGQIITRDRFSRVHLVTAGSVGSDPEAIYRSQRLDMALDALAQTYDHVIIDAGSLDDSNIAALARIARYAVLVAHQPEDAVTSAARERLRAAGFADVRVLIDNPPGPATGSDGARAAA